MSDFLNWLLKTTEPIARFLDKADKFQEDGKITEIFIWSIGILTILVFIYSIVDYFFKLKPRKLTSLGRRKTWWWRHKC